MRVATFNINGIRAARRRGFDAWLAESVCDVVTLQEVRCPVESLPVDGFDGYHLSYDAGSVPGRNGVAVLTRVPPVAVRTWSGTALLRSPGSHSEEPTRLEREPLPRRLSGFAAQGRYIEVDLSDAPLTVASLYLPKGGLPEHLQQPGRMREAPDGGAKYRRKMGFMEGFGRAVVQARRRARRAGREYLLTGDLNVAHTPLDVADWRRQTRSEGFLPEEREWFDRLVGPRRLLDVVRTLNPETPGPYSWWSWMGRSFAEDRGWRIDYQLATPGLARTATAAHTHRASPGSERMSDHAPVVVEYGDLAGRAGDG